MANLLLRLTWQDKAIKKARHSPFGSKESQRLYAYYVSVASDWKHIKYLF